MTIPEVPTVPNPLSASFATDALAFTQWMAAAAPEFDAAADRANLAQSGAQDAATQSGLARDAAIEAKNAASGFATSASLSSSAASDAKSAAEAARDSAATTYIDFDKRFLGDKSVPPTTDNQGEPLAEGALYYNTVQKSMRVWSGSEWDAAYLPSGAYQEALVSGGNLKTINGEDLLGSGDMVVVGSVQHLSKTSAYTASAADKGALIDCSGTWTLGFAAAEALGAGWWCYVRNTGTGTITADPSGAELIDGVASGPIRPGMTLRVQCDGVAFHCLRVGPQVAMQLLTSGTSWFCPLGVRSVDVEIQGAGYGGAKGGNNSSTTYAAPGTPGTSARANVSVTPGTSIAYAIGAGGVGGTFGTGSPGGNTSFSTVQVTGNGSVSGAAVAVSGAVPPGVTSMAAWVAASPMGGMSYGYGGPAGQSNPSGGANGLAGGQGCIILRY